MGDSSSDQLPCEQKSLLSNRSAQDSGPLLQYFNEIEKAWKNLWSKENPEGYIVFCIAENKCAWLPFREVLDRVASKAQYTAASYAPLQGTPILRSELAKVLSENILGVPVQQEEIVCLAGVGPVLNNLIYNIADEGDYIIIPSPTYPGFAMDLRVRCGVKAEFCERQGPEYRLVADDFERSLQAIKARGGTCKGVLIANPDNPTGRVFSREELQSMAEFCSKHELHFISDEVYARSCHSLQPGSSFTSVLSLDADPQRTHVLYGMSKDFGISGFRIGMLISKNQEISMATARNGLISMPSHDTQHRVAAVLSTPGAVEDILGRSCSQLKANCNLFVELFESMGITYTRPESGVFVYFNLCKFLKEQSWEGERQLYLHAFDSEKIVLTPGRDCSSSCPGWFRICFAMQTPDGVREGVQRLRRALENF